MSDSDILRTAIVLAVVGIPIIWIFWNNRNP